MATKIIPHRPTKTAPARKYAPIPSEPGVMIIGKPGDTPPPGYVSIPRLVGASELSVSKVPLGKSSEGALLTPPICRRAREGEKAMLLLDCLVGEHGPGIFILFADGMPCSMYLLNLEHICDPLFDKLTLEERNRIIDHFMETPPAELLARFLPQEKPSFTLLRRKAEVRLWRSQTVASEVHGEQCSARAHYHVTVNSEASMVLMKRYATAFANFLSEAGEVS